MAKRRNMEWRPHEHIQGGARPPSYVLLAIKHSKYRYIMNIES